MVSDSDGNAQKPTEVRARLDFSVIFTIKAV